MSNRFVILHHRVDDGEHWDLMLEHDAVLWTWQLLREPEDITCLPIPANRIGDHRPAYLDYVGPVSRNRGYVTRADCGGWTLVEETPDGLLFDLEGVRFSGRFELRRRGEDWEFRAASL